MHARFELEPAREGRGDRGKEGKRRKKRGRGWGAAPGGGIKTFAASFSTSNAATGISSWVHRVLGLEMYLKDLGRVVIGFM